MLYIQLYSDEWVKWHYGEPVPELSARVVSFQADGDELAYILDCLRKTRPAADPGSTDTHS